MALRKTNSFTAEGSTALVCVSTLKHRDAVAIIDIADVPLMIDGGGRWSAWQAEDGSPIYVRRNGKYLHKLLCQASLVDHRNRNGLDNRRLNLRPATLKENARNRRGLLNASSKYQGVWFCKRRRKWMAGIKYDKRSRYIGTFTSEEDAARAYDSAAVNIFGVFANTNFKELGSV